MFVAYFLHFFFAFPSLFSKWLIFIIIRHELCYLLIHNPLMKLSSVLFKKSLHLSLYLLSYEYVCANCFMFPCICSVLFGSILIPKRVHYPIAIMRILMT